MFACVVHSQASLTGFKSYGTRTVVPNFDPQFNAITGLNGSGKSNILDGICFVLGINNLTQVPARSQSFAVPPISSIQTARMCHARPLSYSVTFSRILIPLW